MQTSVLIVGQGLCGTWLSFWLQQMGVDCLVIDEERPNSSTRVASGIINPVTGRRMALTWMADELIPFAVQAYAELGRAISTKEGSTRDEVRGEKEGQRQEEGQGRGRETKGEGQGRGQAEDMNSKEDGTSISHQSSNILIQRCDIIDFFNSEDRRLAFEKRAHQNEAAYLQWPADEDFFRQHFRYELGYGIVAPAYRVDVQRMLTGWRQWLQQHNSLLPERFDAAALQLTTNGVQYKNITAQQIVFANGVDAAESGYFRLLPFAPNKGEALIVHIADLPRTHMYKKGYTIVPWQEGYFWVGSTYQNQYENALPTAAFRQQATAWLQDVLLHAVTVVDHVAAIRPTNIDRRPFTGWHPQYPQVGILNGTGTKGVTLAPYFARQLAANIAQQLPIQPDANITRFTGVLSRR